MSLRDKSKFLRAYSYALPSLFIWILVLLVYWPGLMSHDSVVQWAEIVARQFSDFHPAFHTLFGLVSSSIFGGTPAGIAIIQVLALSFVCGWGIAYFEELGLPRWVCWTSAILFTLLPVNFVLVNTIWKDVPYSISVLLLSIIFLKIYKTNGQWLKGTRFVWLGLVLALIALFRHNGIAVSAISGVSLLFLLKSARKQTLYALLIFMSAYLGMTRLLFPKLDVTPSTSFKYGVFSYYIAAHLSSDTDFANDELVFLDKIMPVSENWYYSCKVNQSLILSEGGKSVADTQFIEENKKEFFSIFFKAALRNPAATLNHIRCTSSYIWHLRAPVKVKYPIHTKPEIWWVSSNPYDLASSSLLPGLVKPLTSIIKFTDTVFWRAALYLYVLFIILLAVLIRSRDLKYLLPFLPALINTLILILVTPSPEFRYQYSVVLVSALFWPLLFIEYIKPRKTKAENFDPKESY